MNTDLWTYGVGSNSDDVEAVIRNIDTLSYKIYAVVNTEVTGRVRIDNIITQTNKTDGIKTEIMVLKNLIKNHKINSTTSNHCATLGLLQIAI